MPVLCQALPKWAWSQITRKKSQLRATAQVTITGAVHAPDDRAVYRRARRSAHGVLLRGRVKESRCRPEEAAG